MCGLFCLTLLVMNIILYDKNRVNYYPLSYTRPIAYFRCGILTIKEKWEKYYNSVSVKTEEYLSLNFPLKVEKDNLWIDARILPSKSFITELNSLRIEKHYQKQERLLLFEIVLLVLKSKCY